MIIEVNDIEYSEIFASIYNSANELFVEKERAEAAGEIFIPQLSNDFNFLFMDECRIPKAFMSYHKGAGYTELTSLYVKSEGQNKGIGSQLLQYFEEKAGEGDLLLIKVLKNANWAINFYTAHHYQPLTHEIRQFLIECGIIEKPWEIILYRLKVKDSEQPDYITPAIYV